MKKKIKSTIMWVTAASMALCSAGCGEKNKSGDEEVAKLKWVMAGPGKQVDAEKVWEQFNAKLKEKGVNAEVDFEIIPLSEYKQKFTLMLSSREQIDIANMYGLDFSTEISNGTFAPITKLLQDYGKETVEILPDWIFDYMTVDGEVYGIPTYQMLSVPSGWNIPAEYEKYMDMEKMRAACDKTVYANDEIYDCIEEYLTKLKADGKLGLGLGSGLPYYGYETINSNFGYWRDNDKIIVEYIPTSDHLKHVAEKNIEFYQKGLKIRNETAEAEPKSFYGRKDGYVFFEENWDPDSEVKLKIKYDAELVSEPYRTDYFIPMTSSASGTGILSMCKYKEEAMQVLNLVNSDEEMYNLLTFGIEGTHYTKTGEKTMETPTGIQGTINDAYGLYKWITGNTELAYLMQTESEDYTKWVFDEVNQSENRSKLIGFIPDVKSIQLQLSQINALFSEYNGSWKYDSIDSLNERWDEWKKQLEVAGVEDVKNELQRQVDEFLASK